MKGFCRVCPECDGKACRGEVPGIGGTGSGASFIRNVAALRQVKLAMRSIHRVCDPQTEVTLFGRSLAAPVLSAPVAGVVFNMSSSVSEREYTGAVVNGCRDAGVMGSTGDGELEELFDSAEAALREAGGAAIPFIKPWDDRRIDERIERIAAAGAGVFGMDIDAAGLVTLNSVGQPVYPKGGEELKRIAERSGLSFIVKGVMSPEEARTAVDAGADGIVVSNHGGRVLDHTLATAEVLSGIAAEVGGETVLLADGGVRSGVDVFKMLALGADAVLAGRPLAIAAIGGGREAVRDEIMEWREQLRGAMVMTASAHVSDITADALQNGHEYSEER
jgi:isopentenyl diphosphate isomerase/L-lactate dehydrogenase-like FMN-dependent dehydrogenase